MSEFSEFVPKDAMAETQPISEDILKNLEGDTDPNLLVREKQRRLDPTPSPRPDVHIVDFSNVKEFTDDPSKLEANQQARDQLAEASRKLHDVVDDINRVSEQAKLDALRKTQ